MATGDVETRSKRGQWVNEVVGDHELSRSFSSREEAVDQGRTLAEQLGTAHVVIDEEPTGVITDEQPERRPE
ncbi:DUF2188 domain-containing protein [Microbacterium sp. LRZ72]|uniref:DUF2188 domain-containing protein n=1 Tax=Microbacterium sp. LRZ72 TaxID=2942481 RepID=UPI0029A21DB3|nr:DUF2188 domain-containing protein [Microbacterium sp. LRZ72]MDX2376728.1 DUF2188 domain-containing protein [Microbacterium sp. LRZ72]